MGFHSQNKIKKKHGHNYRKRSTSCTFTGHYYSKEVHSIKNKCIFQSVYYTRINNQVHGPKGARC